MNYLRKSQCKRLSNTFHDYFLKVNEAKKWSHRRNCINTGNTENVETWLSKQVGGHINLDKDDATGIATVTLDNVHKRNAITGSMMVEVARVVSDLESWDAGRGLIIVGSGTTFCAGFDLQYIDETWLPGRANDMSVYMHGLSSRLLQLPLISVSCIQGHAFGGGAELIMSCDFRLASSDARISFVHSRLGTTTGYAGTTRLVGAVGRENALKILCSGPVLSADESFALGLVHRVFNGERDFLEECKSWLCDLCGSGPVSSMRAAKQIVHYAGEHTVGESLKYERDMFRKLYGSETHRDAINRFRGRR